MSNPHPPSEPDPSPRPAVPAICDRCRAAGVLGAEPFSALPDILDFTPVQRRAHVNGWRDEHQRAFIAALAITGSPRQAARAIGKHAFGAEQLRTHRSGKSFAAAWDAALDLARDREMHRVQDNLAELARQREGDLAALALPHHGPGEGGGSAAHPERVEGPLHPDCDYDPDVHEDDYPEYWDARQQVRERMLRARRLLLFLIAEDADQRAAWETLCGPVDWEKAAAMDAEDGEAYAMKHAKDPDMLLVAEAGFLPQLTGGRDGMTEIVTEALAIQAAQGAESHTNDNE